jgi:dTDP-glucose 4,6-dehydratase
MTLMKEKSKRILVTGGFGFIGGNFIRFIKNNFPHHHITCIDKNGYASNREYVAGFCDDEHIFDLCDTSRLHSFFHQHDKFDLIFNFAAESHVDNSIKDPSIFTHSNIVGTQNLLENFRNAKHGRMVHISTDEVYGHLGFTDDPFTESTPINPRSPYAASKASSDLLCLAYINTFKCNISITRCCNNYGPNQHSEKFLPTIIRTLSQGKKVPVYGDGLNIREWIHVNDHISACWLVACNGKNEVYNIGSGIEVANIELVDKICTIMGKELDDSVTFVEDRLGHDLRYSIDCSKIRNELIYMPAYTNFEKELKQLVDIYA